MSRQTSCRMTPRNVSALQAAHREVAPRIGGERSVVDVVHDRAEDFKQLVQLEQAHELLQLLVPPHAQHALDQRQRHEQALAHDVRRKENLNAQNNNQAAHRRQQRDTR